MPPARPRSRRCCRTCRARALGGATRPSASSSRARRARRARSETARRSPRHAGSPPAPTRVRCRARAPRQQVRQSPWRRPERSARPSTRRSSPKPRRSCASACGCPHRARSLILSTSTSIEWTPGGHGLLGAMPRSYQVTPEHPRPATSDTAKGGQAQRPTASKRVSSPPVAEPSPHVGRRRRSQIQTASPKEQRSTPEGARVALSRFAHCSTRSPAASSTPGRRKP